MEFFLYVPQVGLTFERLTDAARAAEAAGFAGMAGMDHHVAPYAEDQPLFEAMITNAWIAAHTKRLKVATLVLCDAFRHPALLAKQAVSLDHASGGRFELGLGWGSWEPDFRTFGVTPDLPRERVARLRETLEVLRALWAGETMTYQGEHHRLDGAFQVPRPLGRIPLVIGGAGPKTLALVREFADWSNLDMRYLDRVDKDALPAFRAQIGSARISIQQMVAFVPDGADRQSFEDQLHGRLGPNAVVGSGAELCSHFAGLGERGVERVYTWFAGGADAETVTAFGASVIAQLPNNRLAN